MAQECLVTHDFLTSLSKLPADFNPETDAVFERRHFIYVRDPEYTIEMYLNYLKFVYALYNQYQPHYKGTPQSAVYMLQLGFLPVVYPPSFWEDKLHIMVIPKLRESGLPYYARQASAVLVSNYVSSYPDLWVSKLDAAEFCGCAPKDVTVKAVLSKCGL